MQAASLAATDGYRRAVLLAAQRFATDTARLRTDVAERDLAQARSAELAAQADFDTLRPQIAWRSIAALEIDALATDIGPHARFTGLHRVEQGLWPGSGGALGTGTAAAADALATQAAVLPFALSRVIRTPQAVLSDGVTELDWVDASAGPGQEEQFSHLDAVDVAAGVGAAEAGFALVHPLAMLLDPAGTASVSALFADLDRAVAVLGPAGTRTDSEIPRADWLAAGQHVDATANALAGLAGTLSGATNGAGYGSYGRY